MIAEVYIDTVGSLGAFFAQKQPVTPSRSYRRTESDAGAKTIDLDDTKALLDEILQSNDAPKRSRRMMACDA